MLFKLFVLLNEKTPKEIVRKYKDLYNEIEKYKEFYIDEIKETELGKVMDKIFAGKELGKGKGGISFLTKNEVTRIDLTKYIYNKNTNETKAIIINKNY